MPSNVARWKWLSRLLPGLLLVAAGVAGCSRKDPVALPDESDLYAYCQAVVARARQLVPEEEALSLLHEGRVHQRFGLSERALRAYERASEIDPNLPEPYLEVGYILSQRKDGLEAAVEAYRKALRADPKTPGAHTRIGLIYMHESRFAEAEKDLLEEVRLGTADAVTYYNLAQALALQMKHEEAVPYYRKAFSEDPTLRMAYYGLAQSLGVLGKKDEAEGARRRYLELKEQEDQLTADPKRGYDNLAMQRNWASETWMDVGDLVAACITRTTDPNRRVLLEEEYARAIREAARLDPLSMGAQMALMREHLARAEFAAAAAACEQVLQVYADKEVVRTAFELAGKCLENLDAEDPTSVERIRLSRRILERIVEIAPNFADARRELARLLLFRIQSTPEVLALALDHAQKAVQTTPHWRNYEVLAFALLKSGRPQEAKERLEEGLRRNPGDKELEDRLLKLVETLQP